MVKEAKPKHSPPRRGGVARSAGVVSSTATFRRSSIGASPCRARASRHPICAFAALGASSPPLRGGEYARQTFSADCMDLRFGRTCNIDRIFPASAPASPFWTYIPDTASPPLLVSPHLEGRTSPPLHEGMDSCRENS